MAYGNLVFKKMVGYHLGLKMQLMKRSAADIDLKLDELEEFIATQKIVILAELAV
jgi:hypothetical protein